MVDQQTNWIDNELNEIGTTTNFTGERLPTLKLETAKITKFLIDKTNPFATWTDTKNNCVKAIIPVLHKNEKKNLWLNKKNPLYRQIMERLKKGQVEFAVSTTGNQKETRYTIVEED